MLELCWIFLELSVTDRSLLEWNYGMNLVRIRSVLVWSISKIVTAANDLGCWQIISSTAEK